MKPTRIGLGLLFTAAGVLTVVLAGNGTFQNVLAAQESPAKASEAADRQPS